MVNEDKISVNIDPDNYVKPALDFEEYHWEWSSHSFGIKEEELTEFKHFIRSIIPILSDHLRYIRVLEEITEKKKSLDKYQLGENAFTPFIHLVHSTRKNTLSISYSLQFTWDNQIFVDREENRIDGANPVSVKWELGQIFKK